MPINASLALGLQPVQMENPLNRLAQVMQVQSAQNQNALAQYSLNKAQRQDSQMNALMSTLQGGGVDLTTPEGQMKALSIAPEAAAPLIKNVLEAKQAQSTIGMNEAHTRTFDAEAAAKRADFFRSQIPNTPEAAAQWVRAQYSDPVLGKVVSAMGPVESAVASIPTDPAGFQRWQQQNALGMQKFVEMNKPTTTVVNAGGQSQVLQTPGLGGAPALVGTVQHTVSPDAQLQAYVSRQNNAATNATSRANNADTIKKDLQIAVLSKDGLVNDNLEWMAQAIAAGQAAPITGFALAKPQGQTVMRRVFEINPNYDETTYAAKVKSAKDFASGPQGNALRSVATANVHLDQMGELVDALNNGNVQVFNKLANTFGAQTGNPAPTNFDAVKNIIGQEVVKAIVAGGGTGGERDEAAAAFNNAKSPAQLKGVIQHYRMVMGAQEANLLSQRDAAGLPRSTLPNYSGQGHGGSQTPAGWSYLGTVPAGGK